MILRLLSVTSVKFYCFRISCRLPCVRSLYNSRPGKYKSFGFSLIYSLGLEYVHAMGWAWAHLKWIITDPRTFCLAEKRHLSL